MNVSKAFQRRQAQWQADGRPKTQAEHIDILLDRIDGLRDELKGLRAATKHETLRSGLFKHAWELAAEAAYIYKSENQELANDRDRYNRLWKEACGRLDALKAHVLKA
jgi:hypothetical protein